MDRTRFKNYGKPGGSGRKDIERKPFFQLFFNIDKGP